MRRLLTILAAILLGLASTGIAAAQNYPTRPITMIVPFPAGGATDTLARFLAEQMRPILGQPVVIENVGRRRRQPRRRPRRALGRRRLHAEHRHLDHAYADRRPLRAAVRSVEGSRADHPDRQRAAVDRRQEGPAGGRSEGADRLAEGQSRQGVGRHRRRRRDRPSHRHFVPEGDRHQISVRAVSRQRAGDAGPVVRADRFHDRAVVELQVAARRPAASSPMRSPARRGCPRRRISRPPTRRDCRASSPRSGTDCGCRRTRQRTSSPG